MGRLIEKGERWRMPAMVGTLLGMFLATAVPVDSLRADLIFTEIMYNPKSGEPAWEWVEVYNNGTTGEDLKDWVFDDINSEAQSGSNISSGTIPAGGLAVLFNVDKVSQSGFQNAWGSVANLVGVTGWSKIELNNSGDTISLWSKWEHYVGDHEDHNNAFVTQSYTDSSPFPNSNNSASIALSSLSADPSDGGNWALSTVGDIHGA